VILIESISDNSGGNARDASAQAIYYTVRTQRNEKETMVGQLDIFSSK
jgi:hypothetical protein